MTTVNEFILYLKSLPEETEIFVIVGKNKYDYEPTYYRFEELDLNRNIDFIDLTNNKFVSPDDPRKNSKSLYLGEV